jgi:hypothetical protein
MNLGIIDLQFCSFQVLLKIDILHFIHTFPYTVW